MFTYVIPWWNPAVEAQRRTGPTVSVKKNPVVLYRLVTEGTVEERILALQDKKRQLADAVLAGGGAAGGLSKDDTHIDCLDVA